MTKIRNKKGINRAAVGLAGAVVGAAAGVAAVVLSDKKNRKKIGKTVNNLADEGTKTFNDLKGRIEEWRDDAEKKVEDAKTQLKVSESYKK